MYRRRRRLGDPLAFSFDSFLDVVANVIGIIVRLILVTWVGARTYTAAMQHVEPAPPLPPLPAPTAEDDPLDPELARVRHELAEARRRLLERLALLDLADQQTRQSRARLDELQQQRRALAEQAGRLGVALAGTGKQVRTVTASAEELRRRAAEVLRQIKEVESLPSQKKQLKYHTPVSHAVHTDELFFECRHGRVTFIDLPAFMQEVRAGMEDKAVALRTQWQVTGTTAPVGAFRLRYTVERDKNALEGLGAAGPVSQGFHYGVSEWIAEPVAADRGEPLDLALNETSEFRRLVDRIDPQITVVTFWVYPDSFELFRRLRDLLYERDVEVAGRPLEEGNSIAGSRHGTASRGQ